MRFVIFSVTEHQLIIAQINELGFAFQFFGARQGQRHRQCGIAARSNAT
jgi:hypothetical protein